MRLIDAEILKETAIDTLEKIKNNPKMTREEKHVIAAFKTVVQMIDDMPTVPLGQWISVKDRLLEDKQRILVYSPCNAGSDVGPIAVQSGWMCKNKNHGITHWIPLPEPPKED